MHFDPTGVLDCDFRCRSKKLFSNSTSSESTCADNRFVPSWPFHFKAFERVAIVDKGRRVSDPDPSGYISTWSEGNCYSIRALKQELFRQCPTQQPILLTDYIETDMAQAAARLFGLEWHKIDLEYQGALFDAISYLTCNGQRPIIFAATLANTRGQSDDLEVIDRISRKFPLFLHVDACRVFDYLTTASEELRRALDLPRLRLHHPQLGISGCIVDGEVLAATIVAGGSNAFVFPPPVVALKPKFLGDLSPATVEYVRGSDSTLAGSRDSLGPLMMCLQELRFGESGMRDIYQSCALKRKMLTEELRAMKVPFHAHPSSLDVRIDVTNSHLASKLSELGAKALDHGKFLLTVQPSVQLEDINSLLGLLGSCDGPRLLNTGQYLPPDNLISIYTLPDSVATEIQTTVQQFKVLARSSCGYPLNQAPYSALGPVMAHFLTVKIPDEWIRTQASDILERRKQTFGLLTKKSRGSFKATFTTGSTMGNRIGLHTALARHPNAFVYFSSASHYSVKKIVGDCDDLTSRWKPGRVPRFSEITADDYGRMIPEEFLRQILSDRAECTSHGETYELILFANMGTTFVGGRDDLVEIRKQLAEIDVTPSYIHVDGALDFGFLVDGVRLGPPSVPCTDGISVVQGVTLSHHKVFGIMVSGEVICYSPDPSDQLAALTPSVEPRAVFETWLFEQTYLPENLLSTNTYCLQNASMLRQSLAGAGVPTRFNENCIITLLERPPPWIVEEFQLAPEGDWVHFITMPHISPATVHRFVRAMTLTDVHCATAFDYVGSSLTATLNQHATLKRVTCRSVLAGKVLDIAVGARRANHQLQRIWEDLRMATIQQQLWARYVCGSMSFAAVDDEGEPQVVFLAKAEHRRLIQPSVLLIKSSLHQNSQMLRDVGMQLYGHVARLMDVSLEVRRWSYTVITYSNNTGL